MNESFESGAVLSFAERLAGEDADETVLEAMCAAAAAEIEARLKEGISLADLGSVYVSAAGVLALSMYSAAQNPEHIRGFKAGDLSVSYGSGESAAERLRALAEQMLAGKLRERGFGFMGVQG